jgi:hypothetical protein
LRATDKQVGDEKEPGMALLIENTTTERPNLAASLEKESKTEDESTQDIEERKQGRC